MVMFSQSASGHSSRLLDKQALSMLWFVLYLVFFDYTQCLSSDYFVDVQYHLPADIMVTVCPNSFSRRVLDMFHRNWSKKLQLSILGTSLDNMRYICHSFSSSESGQQTFDSLDKEFMTVCRGLSMQLCRKLFYNVQEANQKLWRVVLLVHSLITAKFICKRN